MAHRDIIVIGASLGAIETLPRLTERLPADLPAAVLIVLHMAPDAPSYLADRLNVLGPLRAAPAINGEPLVPNRIYIAVPDRHLMIEGERVRLSSGPRESHARPAVDVLFRSAAFCCGPRVIGIVLTGMLDDGTAGLWAIKDRGGIAMVQSPKEAQQPSMPASARKHVAVDYCLNIAEMPDVLARLTRKETRAKETGMPNSKLEIEYKIGLDENALTSGVRSLGEPSFYTCPDCEGSMIAIQDGAFKRFRCHTGHAYTAEALATTGLPRVEKSLWGALAQLEQHQVLLRELEHGAWERGDRHEAARHAARAERAQRLSVQLRELASDPDLKPPQEGERAERAGG